MMTFYFYGCMGVFVFLVILIFEMREAGDVRISDTDLFIGIVCIVLSWVTVFAVLAVYISEIVMSLWTKQFYINKRILFVIKRKR